jgi:GntR family transcriptional repressor for pyruvate dehydrogenase complex
LQSRNGEGTYVSEDNSAILRKTLQWSLLLEPKVLDDLMETRLTLECETAAFAALRASPEQMQEMEEGIKGMERSVANPSEYLEYDLKFHLAIAAAAQNSILYPLLTMIRGYLQTWIREALGSQNELDSRQRAQLSVAEHRTILAAVQKHDPDEARRAMAAHIHSSSMDLRRRAAGDSVTPDQVTALQGSTE